MRVLLTGAAGRIGTMLRPRLARPDRVLRLLDVREPAAPGAFEEVVIADMTDLDAMVAACDGVDAVVHLGGYPHETTMDRILRLNVYGSWCVLEAAHRAGVSRVLLASSNHAVGFYDSRDVPDDGLPADVPVRPDTLYGWSKAATEAAGRMYADRYGMDVLVLRIGMCFPEPRSPRDLAIWLSPDDAGRLVEACLTAPSPGFRFVWGISRNSRRWLSLAEGSALGYDPEDDGEVFYDSVVDGGEPDFDGDPAITRLGGDWYELPLGTWR
jgi:nucleoside-diphosphate-sugar epimerase